jgi:hypothetical protein
MTEIEIYLIASILFFCFIVGKIIISVRKLVKELRGQDSFVCKQCNHELPIDFNMRTDGYCYLCDPNVSVEELLSDYENTKK